MVEEDEEILQQLRACTAISIPIAMVGPSQSGKYSFAYFYSHQVNNQPPISLSMQNAQDARDIFGGYVCGEVPGQFHFQPGVLLEAITKGRTILIQNIDNLPVDVFSSLDELLTLLQKGEQFITYLNKKHAIHPLFRLLVTCSTQARFMKSSFVNCFLKVETKLFSVQKIKILLQSVLQNAVLTDFVLDIFQICALPVKVLLKLASRIARDVKGNIVVFNQQFAKTRDMNALSQGLKFILIQEIFDCFLAQFDNYEQPLQQLCYYFKLDIFQVKDYIHKAKHVCEVSNASNTISAGRYHLKRFDNTFFALEDVVNFAMTPFTTRIIQQIVGCVNNHENVLLVSSTGIGKTYTLDIVARMLGKQLIVINFSAQTDVSDLIGGFKPISLKQLAKELFYLFLSFVKTKLDLTSQSNIAYITQVTKFFDELLFQKLVQMVQQFVKQFSQNQSSLNDNDISTIQTLQNICLQIIKMQEQAFFFKFKQGALISAIKEGHFVLFDEINLASSEVLDYLVQILNQNQISFNQYSNSSQDTGITSLVAKHECFRLFASMNPATDAGKKQLPVMLQNCFTTIHIQEMSEYQDLKILVESYLTNVFPDHNLIVNIFIQLKEMGKTQLKSVQHNLPVFSIRIFCRALKYAIMHQSIGIHRALYEGFKLFFTSNLDKQSFLLVEQLLVTQFNIKERKYCFKPNIQSLPFLYQHSQSKMVCVINDIYFPTGPFYKKDSFDDASSLVSQQNSFVITDTNGMYVETLMKGLLSNIAILLEGVTSSGKSSLVLFLANILGYDVIRINNHENIDISDYLGSFQPEQSTGNLVFQYGPLVKAMQQGCWVILDELNLCGSEILEALNRLLDDNAEIYVPETNEIIKPAPGFALFATQNPSGLVNGTFYGGRNKLSEAFRNRFIIMEITEISNDELKFIMSKRLGSNQLPPKFIDYLLSICSQLKLKLSHSMSSKNNDIVSQQITLRDLFRIADRLPDSIEMFCLTVYELIAERQRDTNLKNTILITIQKVCNFPSFDEEFIQSYYYQKTKPFEQLISQSKIVQLLPFKQIVFTKSFQRLFALSLIALEHHENPCLVGDCGSGKTQVSELCAYVLRRKLRSINLHRNTDVTDFIGQLRPLRNRQDLILRNKELQKQLDLSNCLKTKEFYSKQLDVNNSLLNQLFVWYDGPLVESMMQGDLLLIDEISLASDSILERLNSVFETSRQITVVEKPMKNNSIFQIQANPLFSVISTMNPGGDYGKKELSPALRNRMNEIYVTSIEDPSEITQILQQRSQINNINHKICNTEISIIDVLTKFFVLIKTIAKDFFMGKQFVFSIRDIISIYDHIYNQFHNQYIEFNDLVDVLRLCYLDGLQLRSQISENQHLEINKFVIDSLEIFVFKQKCQVSQPYQICVKISSEGLCLDNGMRAITLPKGNSFEFEKSEQLLKQYSFDAPSIFGNVFNIALAIINGTNKPILLESSPGVGKTSLIIKLAEICGFNIVRVNLSEHIDLCDLIGSEIPQSNCFQFVYGPILRAIVDDCWLLLDEVNLANQSVLEGINSLLDHRKELYVPEINNTFKIQRNFKLFGAQNPYKQGGGRKQLPQSFLNRFLCIYLQDLQQQDYSIVSHSVFPFCYEIDILVKVISQFTIDCNIKFGIIGGPWEFNLRDLFRVLDLVCYCQISNVKRVMLYLLCSRFRTYHDIQCSKDIIEGLLQSDEKLQYPKYEIASNNVCCGCISLKRERVIKPVVVFNMDLPLLEMAFISIKQAIPLLFTTLNNNIHIVDRLIRSLESMLGPLVKSVSLSQSTDVSDLLGSYEQMNTFSLLDSFSVNLIHYLDNIAQSQADSISSVLHLKELHNQCTTNEVLQNVLNSYFLIVQRLQQPQLTQQFDMVKEAVQQSSGPQFVWQDGIVTECVEKGYWLYLKNVNYCQPSVLDRLNSLLEKEASLFIYEQGKQEIRQAKIHPNFRVVLAYDASFGEISRAIRNRCFEICVDNQMFINENYFEKSVSLLQFDKQRYLLNYYTTQEVTMQQCSIISNVRSQLHKHNFDDIEIIDILKKLFNFNFNIYNSDLQLLFIKELCDDTNQQELAFVIFQLLNQRFITAAVGLQLLQSQQYLEFIKINSISQKQNAYQLMCQFIQQSQYNYINDINTISLEFSPKFSFLIKVFSQSFNVDEFLMMLQQLQPNLNQQEQQLFQLVSDRYMTSHEFNQFTQSLVYQINMMSVDYKNFQKIRSILKFNQLVVDAQQIDDINHYIELINLKISRDGLTYAQQDILQFLQFTVDPLHQSFRGIANNLHNRIITSLKRNISLFTKNFSSFYLLHNPIVTCFIFKYKNYRKTKAINVNSVISELKLYYNTLLQKYQLIFTQKYVIINEQIELISSICQQIGINDYTEKYLSSRSTKQQLFDVLVTSVAMCLKLYLILVPNNHFDPNKFSKLKIITLNKMVQQIESELDHMKEYEHIVQSQEYLSKCETNQIILEFRQIIFDLKQQVVNEKDQMVPRLVEDDAFLQDFLEKLEILNIQQLSNLNSIELLQQPKQFLEFSKLIMQNIDSLLFQLYKCDRRVFLSYVDIVVPILYALSSLRTFMMLIRQELQYQMEQEFSNEILNSYYQSNNPFLFYFYTKEQGYGAEQLLHHSLQQIVYNKLSPSFVYQQQIIPYDMLAQIAADFEDKEQQEYIDYVNNYSLFRTRQQSKTSGQLEDKEDFDLQMQQMFQDQDYDVKRIQQLVNNEEDESAHTQINNVQFVYNKHQFIIDLGRISLEIFCQIKYSQYTLKEPVQLDYLSLLQVFANRSIEDHDFFVPLLNIVKGLHEQLQQQATENASILAKVRSHTARRSQICQNVYNHAYPSELIEFLPQLLPLSRTCKQLLVDYEKDARLLAIVEIINVIQELPILETRLIKFMNLAEYLLQQIMIWNVNAPKALHFDVQQLKQSIIYWRRIELMSWNSFFSDVEKEQQDIALLQWPSLYMGMLTASRHSNYRQYQKEFDHQMKSFIYNSSIGQFQCKRDLLLMMVEIRLDVDDFVNAPAVKANLLKIYYESQILQHSINDYIKQQFQVIQEKFIKQIKLFQWDERNYDSIRVSTRKSHEIVLRIIRSYSELQRTTVQHLQRIHLKNELVMQNKIDNNDFDDFLLQNKELIVQNELVYSELPQRNQLVDVQLCGFMDFHSQKQNKGQLELQLKQLLTCLIGQFQLDQFRGIIDEELFYVVFPQVLYSLSQKADLSLDLFRKFNNFLYSKHIDIQQSDLEAIKRVGTQLMHCLVYYFVNQWQGQQSLCVYCVSQNILQEQQTLIYNTTHFIKQSMQQILNTLSQYVVNNQFILELQNQMQSFDKLISQQFMGNIIDLSQKYEELTQLYLNFILDQKNKFKEASSIYDYFEQQIVTFITQYQRIAPLDNQLFCKQSLIVVKYDIPYVCPYIHTYFQYIIKILSKILQQGYCAQQQQEENDKKQMQQQGGIGLDDGDGEKDITQDVQDQQIDKDQLLGNDKDDEQGDEQQGDDNNEGIEMSQEFGGKDQDINNNEEEDSENDDSQERDIAEQNLEDADDIDKRAADEEEMNDNTNQETKEQKQEKQLNQQVANDDMLDSESAEGDKSGDKEEQLNISYQPPDEQEQFEDYNEKEMQDNISSQSEMEDDINMSKLFDDIFDEELNKNDQILDEPSEFEQKIEEVDQRFENKEELEDEEQDELSTIQQIDDQDKEIDWQQEEDVQNQDQKNFGFNNGQKNQNDEKGEQIENENEQIDAEKNDQQLEKENDNETNAQPQQQQDSIANESSKRYNKQSQKKEQQSDQMELLEDKASEVNKQDETNEDVQEKKANVSDKLFEDKKERDVVLRDQNQGEVVQFEEPKVKSDENIEYQQIDEGLHENTLDEVKLTDLNQVLFNNAIQSQAQMLSERLKILLEPTQSSALVGDFRSGKKLNIRRIIPFVASGFRRDKIWLRRTKPQKRTYKILLCVDNSFSVQNQQLQTQIIDSLFIIYSACKMGELGKVGIATFGEQFQLLAPLQQMQNEEHLVQQVQQFVKFNERKSDFSQLFENASAIFEEQNYLDSSAMASNILIVLTDGQVLDKQDVASRYRHLQEEQKVIPMFLLYDPKIFDQVSVQFVTVDGIRKVVRKPYLEDDYPLENFVVCERAEDLVEVLCNAFVQVLAQTV